MALLAATIGFSLVLEAAPSFTVQGRITRSDGTLLEVAGVDFKIAILSPTTEQCILYEETFTNTDMSNSKGLFALTIGNGSGARSDVTAGSWSMTEAFSNIGSFAVPSTSCGSGSGTVTYTPSANDERRVLISFKEPSGSWEQMPVASLSHSPYSMESRLIAGFGADALCRVADAGVPQAVTALTSANFTELKSLINGTSTQYLTKSVTTGSLLPQTAGTTPGSAVEGSVWYDSTNHVIKYKDNGGIKTIGTSTGSVTSIAVGTGLTGGPITSTGTLSLAASGVSAATYGTAAKVPTIAVDATGRITSASETSISLGLDDLKSTVGAHPNLFDVSATCDLSKTFSYASATDQFTCVSIGIDGSQITGGTIDAARLPAVLSAWALNGTSLYYSGGHVGIGTSGPAGFFEVIGGTNPSAGAGGAIKLSAQTANGAGNAGGAIALNAGTGNGSGTGGAITLQAGNGGTTGGGGSVSLTGGNGPGTGSGGSITLTGGSGTGGGANHGGSVTITAGTTTSSGSGAPGTLALNGGTASTGSSNKTGGTINITGGTGASSGSGGPVNVTGGAAGATGTGGTVTIKGGTATAGAGGSVNITGAGGVGTNQNGGSVVVTSGAPTGSGIEGNIQLLASNVGIGTTSASQRLTVNGRIESKAGMLFNQGTGATDNLIYLQSASSGEVDASLGFFAAGVGSAGEGDGPYFLARGNLFSSISNQRGNFYFSAGKPSGPGATEGSINFLTGAGVNRLTILNGGNVGIGSAGPGYLLDVAGDVNSSTGLFVAGSQVCTSAGCPSPSDERLKENILPLRDSLSRVLSLRGVSYDWKDKEKFGHGPQVGMIAQEIEKIYPEAVVTSPKTGLKSVAYDHLVAPVIEAVKSVYARLITNEERVRAVETEMASLKAENELLRSRLENIERKLGGR